MGTRDHELRVSRRGVRGDEFRGMVRVYSGPLFRYCFGRLEDRHLAEDAVQETFLRAYRRIGDVASEHVGGWLFAAARRCCLELLRKRKRGRSSGGTAVLEGLAAPVRSRGAMEDEVEAALDRLGDDERSLIYLKHVQGLKCREIANVLGVPLGTVTGGLSRAYGKLRGAMGVVGEVRDADGL